MGLPERDGEPEKKVRLEPIEALSKPSRHRSIDSTDIELIRFIHLPSLSQTLSMVSGSGGFFVVVELMICRPSWHRSFQVRCRRSLCGVEQPAVVADHNSQSSWSIISRCLRSCGSSNRPSHARYLHTMVSNRHASYVTRQNRYKLEPNTQLEKHNGAMGWGATKGTDSKLRR